MIQTSIDEKAIQEKTRELCSLILAQPRFKNLTHDVKAFLDDQVSQEEYRKVSRLGRELHERQMSGQNLEESAISEFEKLRFSLLENPVARAFIEAQSEMNRIQDSIHKHISKSFELGRVPADEDLECEDGCSGSDCGCH